MVHLLNFSALKVRGKFRVFDIVYKTKKCNLGVCCKKDAPIQGSLGGKKKVIIYPVGRNYGIKNKI